MNLSLTADQITVVDGVAYVVAEGELSDDLRTRTRQQMQRHGVPQGTTGNERPVTDAPLDPPAWMTATCKTCDGTGHYVDDRGEVYEDSCTEDDCLNGKPIHTFNVECQFIGCENGLHWRQIGVDDMEPIGVCPGTVSYRLAVREYEYDRDEFMAICDVLP